MADLLERLCTSGARIDGASLDVLMRTGEVLERVQRTGRPKVIRLVQPAPCNGQRAGQNLILKLWYPKRGLSSATFLHYATRFRRHAARLRQAAVTAPEICGWGNVDGTGVRFVCYPEIAGRTLREWIPEVDLEAAGAFVAALHDARIDFRSLHMGNIVWAGGNRFGLIDVTDCYFPWFMSRYRRLRRLTFFCGHRLERGYLTAEDNWQRFVSAYCRSAGLDPEWMITRIARHLDSAGEEPGQ